MLLPRTAFAFVAAIAYAAPAIVLRHLGDPTALKLPYYLDGTNARAFSADLDNNGQDDLILVRPHAAGRSSATACATVSIVLTGGQAWQASLRIARTQQEQDPPVYVTDRNSDGFAEVAVIPCADTSTLHAVYEVRPEGLTRIAPRLLAKYGGDVRKHYNDKSIAIPKDDAPPAADPAAAASTIESVATPAWGSPDASPAVTLAGTRLAGWPKLEHAPPSFQRVRVTSEPLTDLLDALARSTPAEPLTPQTVRIYPSEAPLTEIVAAWRPGTPRERRIAVVDGEVPRDPRDATFFLVRDNRCFAFHAGSGESVGVIRSPKCEVAQTLHAKGLTEAPIHIHSGLISQVNGSQWRSLNAIDNSPQRVVPLDGPATAAMPFGAFLIAQRPDASLTLYQANGTRLTNPLPVPATDQLLYIHETSGWVFVRWDGDRPVAWIEVPAHVEWRRHAP